MDIDHIRHMVRKEQVRVTTKFQQWMIDREFSLKQAEEALMGGRIVEIEKRRKPNKHIIIGFVNREGVLDELCIELAITDVVIFISGYWPKDKTRKRR